MDYVNIDGSLYEARNIISQMDVEDLKKIIANDDEILKIVRNLSEVQQLEVTKESLKENAKRLALKNLDKGPVLIQARQHLSELHDELGQMREEYKTVRRQYEEDTGDANPEMIWVIMQSTASELDRTTDQTADDFFYGEKTEEEVSEFERKFIESRKKAHELKVKAEKLNELMQVSQATQCLQPRGGYGFNEY
ncbi:unnamed protein product [Didymodactylos carnosus]|uniref:VPS37 C-terminal domain-containing protein n=1 Tax=Didymodactylos carnosus TaxID=1234261 RepID=A0A813VEU3_9BILA|nr:unnamed protein product [Didymodactylos carnosus]CAF1375489.1 unnamed protein product [Didymodactylos carnosus]CAF3628086.1 unnamed protein product [Didymodactylos carnosus]CAF4184348.1 unnamed protein product [Didymodactylos carnosus]